MNTQYLSFVVVVLANILPLVGVQVANDQLTVFVQVGVSIVAGLYGIFAGWRDGAHTLGGRSL